MSSRWDDLRLGVTIGTPLTRIAGTLDGLAHAARLDIEWLCDWYDQRLIGRY